MSQQSSLPCVLLSPIEAVLIMGIVNGHYRCTDDILVLESASSPKVSWLDSVPLVSGFSSSQQGGGGTIPSPLHRPSLCHLLPPRIQA